MIETERAPFAGGDYLTRYPSGHSYAFRIDAPFEKPGWKARSFSPAGHAVFPGSTVEFEDKLYEVVFQDYDQGPPLTIRYYLNPWEVRFPIRSQFHYNKRECLHAAALYRNRRTTNRSRTLLAWLAPLIGLLPAEDQIRISNRYSISSTRMTFISALAILPAAGFAILQLTLKLIHGIPLPGPESLHWLYPFGFYFLGECFLRMLTASKLEEPVGSLFVSLPVLTWRAMKQKWDPKAKQKSFEALEPGDSRGREQLSKATDQILPVQEGGYLEVISLLPKPHWNQRVAISLNGAWYGLVKSDRVINGKKVSYRFVLKRAAEGTWFASVLEYDPDEVQILYKEKRRKDLKTWVDTFAFLWGLLNREDQARLEELYEFDALKFTRITVISLFILALANLAVSLINLFAGVGTILDGWLLLIAGIVLLESYSRWKDWKRGEPSGSVFGLFVRPFARRILAGP